MSRSVEVFLVGLVELRCVFLPWLVELEAAAAAVADRGCGCGLLVWAERTECWSSVSSDSRAWVLKRFGFHTSVVAGVGFNALCGCYLVLECVAEDGEIFR